jgi:DNA-binding NtrC family response regulator
MLLVDVAAASAAHTVSLLRTRLEEGGFPVALGLACAPRDGREPTALRACCETGLRSSEPEAPAEAQFDRGIIQRLSATIERVASSSLTVLILGETGVGKEVMARTLHERSSRRDAPMVSLNCAAFSEQLIESELFGHERGAFTGATQQKVGLLESARGGTVFLDELAEMPLSLQAKLLRVLEAREVLRVGSLRPRPIDVRFIAATNRDLSAEVAAGRFRQDLFFRVNGVTLVIPPLRDRPGEIEPLARAFLAQACAQAGRARVPTFSSSALDLLRSHQWPGNIRELRNLIERAVLLCDGDVIGVEHCTDRLSSLSSASLRSAPPVHGPAEASVAGATGAGARTIVPPDAREGASDERRRLLDALERCAGNQTHAARLLGISRRTLIHRIEAFDIPRPRKRDDAP